MRDRRRAGFDPKQPLPAPRCSRVSGLFLPETYEGLDLVEAGFGRVKWRQVIEFVNLMPEPERIGSQISFADRSDAWRVAHEEVITICVQEHRV